MSHKLDFIQAEHIISAMKQIDQNDVPKDHEWNEYWIAYHGRLYPFKYTIATAAGIAGRKIGTTFFQSNQSSRGYAGSLGFHIRYESPTAERREPAFWAAASYFGKYGQQQTDMLPDFKKTSTWRTDHDTDDPKEGARIFKALQKVRVNDRIAVRYFTHQSGIITVAATGTVSDISQAGIGTLGVKWDVQPYLYSGDKPTGAGAGNWWKTLTEINRPEDIELIFGQALAALRAARITWNDNGYVYPSGRRGKSTNKDTHEETHGYGHEEWLMDTGKLIDGYHYGFLQPVRKHNKLYSGRTFDISLYAINSENKLRYWVGRIKLAEVISAEEAESIQAIYEARGWWKEMDEQIRVSGANDEGYCGSTGLDAFNIRFKPEDLITYDPYIAMSEDDPAFKAERYNLLFLGKEVKTPDGSAHKPFKFKPTDKEKDKGPHLPEKILTYPEPKAVEITYIHDAIVDGLIPLLRKIHGENNVAREHEAGFAYRSIDIAVSTTEGPWFYEIKTYNNIMSSIREAIGQLMEYNFWPGTCRAAKLIVVTQKGITNDAAAYFGYLRENMNMNIYYQMYDLDSGTLSDEY